MTPDTPVEPEGGQQTSFPQFVWLWNRMQQRGTPTLHLTMSRWLHNTWRDHDRRLLLMVFRDAGKSTLVGLYCAWLLACRPALRILVVSAESQLALKMTRNVRRIIERHPATGHLLPERPEQWASDQLTVKREVELRDPSLLARGLSGNLTGCRADVVICDDTEVPNTCDTPAKREDLRARLSELGFVLTPDGTMLYVGTPHSFYSIYAEEAREGEQRPFLNGYERLTLPVLDEQGTSRWPDRFPDEAIEEIRRSSGEARFRSQMLLVPTHLQNIRLVPERLVRYEDELVVLRGNGAEALSLQGRRITALACFWDPAAGRPDTGDSSVIAVVFNDGDGGYWLHAIRYLPPVPDGGDQTRTERMCADVIAFLEDNEVDVVEVEQNGVGTFLPDELKVRLRRKGSSIRVMPRNTSREKNERIMQTLDPMLSHGALRAHARIWDTPLVREMREWLPTSKRNRDDGLDAVTACLECLPARRAPAIAGLTRPTWRAATTTMRAQTEFAAL